MTRERRNEAQTEIAAKRWRYILHLAQTNSGPEIARILGVSTQRVYQLMKKAQEHEGVTNGRAT